LDEALDFSAQVWAEREADKREQFGDDWGRAKAVITAFCRFGVYLSDVSPSNIRWA
jgi:hypothetical protein